MDSASDAEVIAASAAEPQVFGEIFDRHAHTLMRFLVRRVGRQTAEGLVGEVFRIAFERRATFDAARTSARPWLYGIASNLVLKHRRSEARRLQALGRLAGEREQAPTRDDDAGAVLDARAFWPQVAGVIDALPDGERAALLLFVWEDQSYEEIATALEIPVGTVRSRMNRARKRLRELRAPTGKQLDKAGTEAEGATPRRQKP